MPAPPDPMIRTSVSTCMGSVLTRHRYTVSPALQTARWIKARPRALSLRIQPGANTMPDKRTVEKAREDKREGKSAMTQAGEFVKEQIEKIRRGVHGARSTRQAIAIGLSEARRAGVDLPPPRKGKQRARARAPSTPTRWGRGSASRAAARACRARVRTCSSASRAAPRRARRCRARRAAPPSAAARRSARPPPARRRARKALRRFARRPPKKAARTRARRAK